MARFPTLKTGAVAQYPLRREQRSATRVVEFLDGTEQRYALTARPRRRWVVRLEGLDEEEVGRLFSFFLQERENGTGFEFTDPQDGREYSGCQFEEDTVAIEAASLAGALMTLTIREGGS